MRKRTIWITSAAAAAALVLGGTAIAFASTDGFEADDDRTATATTDAGSRSQGTDDRDDDGTRDSDDLVGDELAKASEAALAATDGGTVIEAERSDDGEEAYEVEVRLDSGAEADVELDESFSVIRVDDEGDDRDDD